VRLNEARRRGFQAASAIRGRHEVLPLPGWEPESEMALDVSSLPATIGLTSDEPDGAPWAR